VSAGCRVGKLAGLRHDLAEGQRRYVESLSAYARQFLERIEKPDVDLIDGWRGDCHQAKKYYAESAVTVSYRYGDLRLPAPAVCSLRDGALPFFATGW